MDPIVYNAEHINIQPRSMLAQCRVKAKWIHFLFKGKRLDSFKVDFHDKQISGRCRSCSKVRLILGSLNHLIA